MSNGIRLHPEHGVNPTILQYQCPATGNIWESNELALLGMNRGKKAGMNTLAGLRFCPEVQEKLEEGYVVLVGVDAEKTTDETCPYRTGTILYLRKEVAENMFTKTIDTMAYVEEPILLELIEMSKAGEENG